MNSFKKKFFYTPQFFYGSNCQQFQIVLLVLLSLGCNNTFTAGVCTTYIFRYWLVITSLCQYCQYFFSSTITGGKLKHFLSRMYWH